MAGLVRLSRQLDDSALSLRTANFALVTQLRGAQAWNTPPRPFKDLCARSHVHRATVAADLTPLSAKLVVR